MSFLTLEIIPDDQGLQKTPSYVAFTDSKRLIGDTAKNRAGMNPLNTIFGAKCLIGRRFSDPKVQSCMQHWPFKVVRKDDKPLIQVEFRGETKLFTPEEISSMVLLKMKETAEALPWYLCYRCRRHRPLLLQLLSASSH